MFIFQNPFMNRHLPVLFIFLWIQTIAFAQPANDNLCNALTIEIGGSCTDIPNVDNTTATAEDNEPEVSCAEGTPVVSNSVWYSFVASAHPVHLLVTPDDLSVAFQMNLFTLSGDCTNMDSLSLVACNTPLTNLIISPSIITTLTEGQTYYIQISGRKFDFPGEVVSAGTGCLTIEEITPPANDNVCNATTVDLDAGAQIFSNRLATAQDGEAEIAPPFTFRFDENGWGSTAIDHSVWFTFTTPPEGGNVLVDLTASNGLAGGFNSQLAVYQVGECTDFSTFSLVQATDDAFGPNVNGGFSVTVNPSMNVFCLEGNTTYYVLVDGGETIFGSPIVNQGLFSLAINTLPSTSIEINTVANGPDCAGDGNGSIVISATGGAGVYTYAWNTGATESALLGNLTAGTYTVTVTDQCGDSLVQNIEVPTTANGAIGLTNIDQTICATGPITLTPTPVGGIPFGTKNLYYQDLPDFQTINLNRTFIQQPSQSEVVGSNTTEDIRVFEMEFVGEQLYGINFNQELFRIDTNTGELTLVDTLDLGQEPFTNVADLSFVPSQVKLYVTSSNGDVYDLNWATGETTLVLSTGITGIMQMAIDNSGTIYGQTFADQPQGIFKVDLATGDLTTIAASTRSDLGFLALEIDPSTDKLYAMNSTRIGDHAYLEYTEWDKTTLQVINTFSDLSNTVRPIAFAFKAAEAPAYQYNWAAADGITDPSLATQTVMVNETTDFAVAVTDACGTTSETTLRVNVVENIQTAAEATVIIGTNFNDIPINSDTVVMQTFVTANGCDSIVTTTITTVLPPPANDDLCDAIVLTIGDDCGTTANVDLTGATAQLNEPKVACARGTDSVIASVWYSFVAPANPVFLKFTPDAGTGLLQMNLFAANQDCTDLSSLENVDCNTPVTNLLTAPSLVATLTEGTTYYLQISGQWFLPDEFNPISMPATGTGCLTIEEITTPPANDDVCNAIELTLNEAPQTFTNLGATVQEGEMTIAPPMASTPFALDNDGWQTPTFNNSVWFTFTTPEAGGNVTIDLTSSNQIAGAFNSEVAVYTVGDCMDFSTYELVIAGDNSLPFPPRVNPSLPVFCLAGNTTYYVVVDGASQFFFDPIANQGNFEIAINLLESTPITVQAIVNAPACPGDTDGSIALGTNGGAGAYTYAWNTGAMTPILLGNLAAGDYTVTVTDQCGETVVESFAIATSANGAIVPSNIEQTICEAGELVLNLNPTGGIPFSEKNLFFQNQVDFGVQSYGRTFVQNPRVVDTFFVGEVARLGEMEFVGETLYGVDFDGNFYQIATDSGTTTLLGVLDLGEGAFVFPTDLSYVPAREKLYVVANTGNIFEIDLATNTTNFVQSIGLEGLSNGAIDNSGTLFFRRFGETAVEIYQFNIDSGELTQIGAQTSINLGFLNLEIDPNTDKLYGMVSVSTGERGFTLLEYLELDKNTFQPTQVFSEAIEFKRPSAMAFKLAAAPTYQYNWVLGNGIVDTGLTTQTVTINETTIFPVTITDACGTALESSITINVADQIETIIDTVIEIGGAYNDIIITADTVLMEMFTTNAGCDSLVTINISTTTTSLDTWPQSAIQISPNPAHDWLRLTTLNLGGTDVQVYVRDIYGRVLSTTPLNSETMTLDISNLEVGNYFVEIRSKDKVAVRRFVRM